MASEIIGPDAIEREYDNVKLWRRARLDEEGKLCVGCGDETEDEDSSIELRFTSNLHAGVTSKLRICQSCLNIVALVVDRRTKRDGVKNLIHGWVEGARSALASTRK